MSHHLEANEKYRWYNPDPDENGAVTDVNVILFQIIIKYIPNQGKENMPYFYQAFNDVPLIHCHIRKDRKGQR